MSIPAEFSEKQETALTGLFVLSGEDLHKGEQQVERSPTLILLPPLSEPHLGSGGSRFDVTCRLSAVCVSARHWVTCVVTKRPSPSMRQRSVDSKDLVIAT